MSPTRTTDGKLLRSYVLLMLIFISLMRRPPMSPFCIAKYIENTLLATSQFRSADKLCDYESLLSNELQSAAAAISLQQRVCVPVNATAKPLSAAATCVCVIPSIGVAFVPKYLQNVWCKMQNKVGLQDLMDINYFDTCKMLESVWIDATKRRGERGVINAELASLPVARPTRMTASASRKSREVLKNIIALTNSVVNPASGGQAQVACSNISSAEPESGLELGPMYVVGGDWTVVTLEIDPQVRCALLNRNHYHDHYHNHYHDHYHNYYYIRPCMPCTIGTVPFGTIT